MKSSHKKHIEVKEKATLPFCDSTSLFHNNDSKKARQGMSTLPTRPNKKKYPKIPIQQGDVERKLRNTHPCHHFVKDPRGIQAEYILHLIHCSKILSDDIIIIIGQPAGL